MCQNCPQGTQRYIGKGDGTNRTSCACRQGFWRQDRVLGLRCFPCPTGGICQGVDALPFPEEGYWAITQKTGYGALAQKPSIASSGSSDLPVLQTFDPFGSVEVATDPPYFSCLASRAPKVRFARLAWAYRTLWNATTMYAKAVRSSSAARGSIHPHVTHKKRPRRPAHSPRHKQHLGTSK